MAKGANGQSAALGSLQRKPGCSLQNEHGQTEQAAQQREGRDEAEQGNADVVAVGVHRNARVHVADGDAEEQGRKQRTHEEQGVPRLLPTGLRFARGILQRDRADDEAHEHEDDGQVETGERGGVCRRERGEQRAARGQEPNLVAVPHRTDAAAQERLFLVGLGDEGTQDAGAQVESVKNEVSGDQYEDEDEPDDSQYGHGYFASSISSLTGLPSRSSTGPLPMKPVMRRAQAMKMNV